MMRKKGKQIFLRITDNLMMMITLSFHTQIGNVFRNNKAYKWLYQGKLLNSLDSLEKL